MHSDAETRTTLSNLNPISEYSVETVASEGLPWRGVKRKRRYMSRRDIIHMPATRLARHSGRRGNITFFPIPLSFSLSLQLVVRIPVFVRGCSSFLHLRHSHARPEMTPVGTWNRADNFLFHVSLPTIARKRITATSAMLPGRRHTLIRSTITLLSATGFSFLFFFSLDID